MPKNTVSDPITDQEMAFVHLILSGTMNDRRAAEAVGLNPDTAAYTKAKPRVRAYMIEHRAAVKERLVDQEVERLRNWNVGRDQILDRLWELANLSPEATKGSITGQMKALAMIVAIEGLIPDRRLSPSGTQHAAPPIQADSYPAAPPEPQPASEPASKPANGTSSLNLDQNQPSVVNPFINPERLIPAATNYVFDTVLDRPNSVKLSFSPDRPFSGRRG
jgi:hypothetical protein